MALLGTFRVFVLAFLLATSVCHGKVWKGSARLSPKRSWVALTNFAFDIGRGEVSDTMRRVLSRQDERVWQEQMVVYKRLCATPY